ncbi:hypothetical protein V8F06_006485 [Rhypophila decipiens]
MVLFWCDGSTWGVFWGLYPFEVSSLLRWFYFFYPLVLLLSYSCGSFFFPFPLTNFENIRHFKIWRNMSLKLPGIIHRSYLAGNMVFFVLLFLWALRWFTKMGYFHYFRSLSHLFLRCLLPVLLHQISD